MNIAVVTGASTGMGREFVYEIAKRYRALDEIWILSRSEEKLNELSNKIKNIKVRVVPCDITKAISMQRYKDLLASKKPNVRLLVNSAGVGIIGNFTEVPQKELESMCELNCTALTNITRITIPYMAGKKSNIINMASASAFFPQPAFAVYAASKSYVLSLSTALNKELKHYGITVTAVCPGPVNTEFFKRAESYHKVKPYKKLFMADPKQVVFKALNDAEKKRYISVYGIGMKAMHLIGKLVPSNIITKFISS